MAVNTTGEYKILGMLTQISDEEFGRWGNQAPLIRSEILKRVMSGPQKIKGIDLEVTDLFNRASQIDSNVVCHVAVKVNVADDEQMIALFTLNRIYGDGLMSSNDDFSWTLSFIDLDDDLEVIKMFANAVDNIIQARRDVFQAQGSRFETWIICQNLWKTIHSLYEMDINDKALVRLVSQGVEFALGRDVACNPADQDGNEWQYDWASHGGQITLFNGDTYDVGPDFLDGFKEYWINKAKNAHSIQDAVVLMEAVSKSGVMASSYKFDYFEIYSHIPGFREDLTDLKIIQSDSLVNDGGMTDIIDGFAFCESESEYTLIVLSRGSWEDSYAWNWIYDWGQVANHFSKMGLVDEF